MTRGRPAAELGHPLDHVKRDPDTDCWLWQGPILSTGYGRFGKVYAHRLYYETFNDTTIPDGMHVDHLCRVRHCVNPDHLEVVTPKENILRGVGAAAQNAQKTHCAYGHELAGDNLRIVSAKRGQTRMCVECNRRQQREVYERRKALGHVVPSKTPEATKRKRDERKRAA